MEPCTGLMSEMTREVPQVSNPNDISGQEDGAHFQSSVASERTGPSGAYPLAWG